MSPRAIALSAAAALVALGGVYLLIEVRSSGASAPSEKAIAEAAARSGRSVPPPPPPSSSGASGSSGMSATRASIPSIGRSAMQPPRPRDDMAAPNLAQIPGIDVETKTPPPVGAGDAEFEQAMLETNKLYDRHNYEDARQQALKLLEKQPGTVRMLRVVVSSSCILGDAETAQRYWNELPDGDRVQMTERCSRYDVTFTDKRK